ncbi:MAG TPA: LON peptidase substrate-binding domain-containing protein [Polyangiaceae bacterium]|jgi:ATP-dependent Lon protease|nr:LON peptidase substrate-binding domain-containing protein [Polyangiaceae bacterium]
MTGPAEILSSALEAMPVFPLRGVVLFPGALLPLHVFEPRYRTMLADAMATHRCLALGYALDDAEHDVNSPPIARIAGAGLVVHHAALPDGRSNIVIQGQARVTLDELPFVGPYRRARARLLGEIETPVSSMDRTGLVAAAATFAGSAGKRDFELPAGVPPGAAADLCAHHLIEDPEVRQHVLEELDIAARVRFVTATLAEQMGRGPRDPARKPS